jgi:hypothetical protein
MAIPLKIFGNDFAMQRKAEMGPFTERARFPSCEPLPFESLDPAFPWSG